MTDHLGQYRLPRDTKSVTERHKRILSLAGLEPASDDFAPVLSLGNAAAAEGEQAVFVTETALAPLLPRHRQAGPLGLIIDHHAPLHDGTRSSDLETYLATALLDDRAMLDTANRLSQRLRFMGLYGGNDGLPPKDAPQSPYSIVVAEAGMSPDQLCELTVFARTEQRGMPVYIWSERADDLLATMDLESDVHVTEGGTNLWDLLDGATSVFTQTSFAGFLAIYAGHKPRVFGAPFYAGWGLTDDETALPRRTRRLTRAQLFLGAMMEFPVWYDPFQDCRTDLSRIIDILEAELPVLRADQGQKVAMRMSMWKRTHFRGFFGDCGPLRFSRRTARPGEKVLLWGMDNPEQADAIRVEDGFLRSKGLGAKLIAPMSLAPDDLGIYYNAQRPSRLEKLIEASAKLPDFAIKRAERLRRAVLQQRLSKYNLGQGTVLSAPPGSRVILVPGQVEDDASIRYGCDATNTNLELLERARAENPDAYIIYKPHPDVTAGMRKGVVPDEMANELADAVMPDAAPADLLDQVDEVWTMTSLMGFEALMRGKQVTCLGMPFYSGWGLTTDLGLSSLRRTARPSLDQLVHATLIAYPRYLDPTTGLICPAEVIVERLGDPDFEQDPAPLLARMVQKYIPRRIRQLAR